MAWFKVDDNLAFHSKVMVAGLAARTTTAAFEAARHAPRPNPKEADE